MYVYVLVCLPNYDVFSINLKTNTISSFCDFILHISMNDIGD